jgi:DNA-binding GntR family transcriptional regulator
MSTGLPMTRLKNPPTSSSADAAPGSAAARAYAHVKQRLLDGRFAGGALLSENELAQQLGLSRTPVRQAFIALEAEGLLELYPKRGALVVPVSAAEIEDVFEARLLVEEHCVRRAAQHGGPDLIVALRASIAAQEEAQAAADRPGFARADREFHHAIVAAARNAILLRLSGALRDRQQRIAAVSLAGGPDFAERFIAEHRGIVAALERRDGEEAVRLAAAHLHGARESARGGR